MQRTLPVLLVLVLLAPAAAAFHRSVGGDIHTQFPPAEETDGPDVAGDFPMTGDMDLVAGKVEYVNTLNASLSAVTDRTSPADQVINDDSIGYFDAVDVQYVGTFQQSANDPIDFVLDDTPGTHLSTVSPNIHYQLPPLSELGFGEGHTGVLYPTVTYWYAYLFGEGSAQDAAGADLTADHPSFDGLIEPSDCVGTPRCQLFRPADLQALVADKPGQQAAICGWVPKMHWHPGASVSTCRDFDFGYVSDNVEDLGGQNQPESPAWVWAGVPGWIGNVAITHQYFALDYVAEANPILEGVVQFADQYEPLTESLVMHFTVGAAFDPYVQANGGIAGNGSGQLACLEPGFDVNAFLAHDLDIYDVPDRGVADTGQSLKGEIAGISDTLGGNLGPVGDAINTGLDLALELAGQGSDVVFEPGPTGADTPYDTYGAISVSTATAPECVDEDGDHDDDLGKIVLAPGETTINRLLVEVNQDLAYPQAPPFRDPIETANPDDDHSNAGGGVQLYFSGFLEQESDTQADIPMFDGYYDTLAESDTTCAKQDTFGNICMGDQMHTDGYRDPTSLVWVFRGTGPLNFLDWDEFTEFVWATYADTDVHCAIGASRNVFDAETGQVLRKDQVFDAILKRVSPGDSIEGLTPAQKRTTLRQTLCEGADTLDYFPGTGVRDHFNGNSLGNPFGWHALPGWGGVHTATLDVYYVLSVDKTGGLDKDKLGLHELTVGDPTVVEDTGDVVTMVWQDRVEIGTQA